MLSRIAISCLAGFRCGYYLCYFPLAFFTPSGGRIYIVALQQSAVPDTGCFFSASFGAGCLAREHHAHNAYHRQQRSSRRRGVPRLRRPVPVEKATVNIQISMKLSLFFSSLPHFVNQAEIAGVAYLNVLKSFTPPPGVRY